MTNTALEKCITFANQVMVTDAEKKQAKLEHAALVAVAEAAEKIYQLENSPKFGSRGSNVWDTEFCSRNAILSAALAQLAAVRGGGK